MEIKDLEKRKDNLEIYYFNKFKHRPNDFFSSPGRMEVLGNHTDHNLGLVIVAAINLDVLAATSKRDDNYVIIQSQGYPTISINLSDLTKKESEVGLSIGLARGVFFRLQELGYTLGGFEAYLDSNIPSGIGVSSSAAFECLVAKIMSYYYNSDKITPFEIATSAQWAERVYFEKPCGLLDQCGVAFGGLNLIDFINSGAPKIVKLNFTLTNCQAILVNTGGSHSNLTELYTSITSEMREVANYFKCNYLRELPREIFFKHIPSLRKVVSDRAILRATHFYFENDLVLESAKAIENNEINIFLKCVRQSSRNSFELLQNNFNPRSDKQNIPLALGYSRFLIKNGATRIHGGGFEGSILTFIHKDEVENYVKEMSRLFKKENVHLLQIRSTGPIRL